MKYFSLLPWPPPPSQKWNSVLLVASFYDGKHKHEANLFWKSEIVTMKSSTPPPPLVKNISLHWLQGIFETVPYWIYRVFFMERGTVDQSPAPIPELAGLFFCLIYQLPWWPAACTTNISLFGYDIDVPWCSQRRQGQEGTTLTPRSCVQLLTAAHENKRVSVGNLT